MRHSERPAQKYPRDADRATNALQLNYTDQLDSQLDVLFLSANRPTRIESNLHRRRYVGLRDGVQDRESPQLILQEA